MQVHPDLFGQFPELKAKNDFAVQQLMGVLDDVKSGEAGDFVAPRTVELEFIVRTSTPGHFLRVPATLRLTGNNCQHVLAKSLSELFGAVGLPPSFHWGSNYWDRKVWWLPTVAVFAAPAVGVAVVVVALVVVVVVVVVVVDVGAGLSRSGRPSCVADHYQVDPGRRGGDVTVCFSLRVSR